MNYIKVYISIHKNRFIKHPVNILMILCTTCLFPVQGHLLVLADATALIQTKTAWPYTNRGEKMKVTVIAKVHHMFGDT